MAASSSNRPPRPSAPSAEPAADYIDWGPELPESSGQPRIVALVRDPRCYFACWEEGERIRARDVTTGTVEEHAAARVGSRYFEGIPEHDYEVELFAGGKIVARSLRIRLPRADPAAAADPAWRPTAGQEEILRELRGGRDLSAPDDAEGRRRWVEGLPVSRPSRTT